MSSSKTLPFKPVRTFDVRDNRGVSSDVSGARDNTLLQRLGFVDRDKGNPKHDFACLYLAENAWGLHAHALNQVPGHALKQKEIGVDTQLERHVVKGSGRYRTTIGFLDVHVAFSNVPYVWQDDDGGQHVARDDVYVGVEVKIEPVSAGDLLRQLQVYREFAGSSDNEYREFAGASDNEWFRPYDVWVAALAYQPSETDARMLKHEGIRIVRLGAKFEKWCAAQRDKKAANVPEV